MRAVRRDPFLVYREYKYSESKKSDATENDKMIGAEAIDDDPSSAMPMVKEKVVDIERVKKKHALRKSMNTGDV